jgi:hypothetical protein
MRTRKPGVLTTGMVGLALAASVLCGCTVEQILIGQWYTIDTPQVGACPRLEWRFFVNPQRMIAGFLSRDGQLRIAELSGVLNADDSFQITISDVAGSGSGYGTGAGMVGGAAVGWALVGEARAGLGNRTASVTGRFTSQVSTLSIRGDAAGNGCDGQTFELRLGGYFSRQGGGGGGGGG